MNNSFNEINIFKICFKYIKDILLYLKHNYIKLLLLVIIGFLIAYYTTPILKKYNSQIIIIPNNESVDYLYNDIELINSKINNKDQKFLNENNISSSIKHIEIKPIVNIYQFINNHEQDKNFELIKLFAEDGDINKVASDEKTSKNYKTHEINILSNDEVLNSKDIDNLIEFLNKNKFYSNINDIYQKNIKSRINHNNKTINQINLILDKYTTNSSITPNLLYFNNNLQLDELINSKNKLIKENENLLIKQIESSSVIKKVAQFLNKKIIKNSYLYYLIYPICLIILFLILQSNIKKLKSN